MTKPDLAAIAARCATATEGPWYTVQPPWRGHYYNKATDMYEMLGTYVVAGDPDPHVGTPVLDSIDIDEWDGDTGPDYSQSDADLNFGAHARTDIQYLLAYIAKLEAQVARLKRTVEMGR